MFPPEFAVGKVLPFGVVSKWLRGCGKGTRVYQGCRLSHPERIEIGANSQIDEGVFIFAGDGVTIGSHVHLAFGSSISGGGRCLIHDFVGIGAGTRLLTGTDLPGGDGLTNPTIPAKFRRVRRGRIEIGAHAIVFTNSVVFPDVTIGEGAVVSAGTLVHRNLADWGIYGGNPLVQVGVRPKDQILQLAQELMEAELHKRFRRTKP